MPGDSNTKAQDHIDISKGTDGWPMVAWCSFEARVIAPSQLTRSGGKRAWFALAALEVHKPTLPWSHITTVHSTYPLAPLHFSHLSTNQSFLFAINHSLDPYILSKHHIRLPSTT